MKQILTLFTLLLSYALGWAQATSLTVENNQTPVPTPITIGTINGHEYVDLGLSVKWATCNIGASTPGEYGNYYAWGETYPKPTYTKENSATYGKETGSIGGNYSYDAARANWGSTWRMPTKSEFEELMSRCAWTWTTRNGHTGYLVRGPNHNTIFLPAAGFKFGWGKRIDAFVGEEGQYWSSSSYSDSRFAWYLIFRGGVPLFSGQNIDWCGRNRGRSVRPVSE